MFFLRRQYIALLLALALLLPACSALHPYGLFLPQVDNTTLHAEVFQESLRRIDVYYLEPVALDKLVAGGLNGLTALDPAISAQLTPSHTLRLMKGSTAIFEHPAATANNWQDWGTLTLQGIQAAAAVSPALASATPEAIYDVVLPAMTQQLDGFSHYNTPEDVAADREWDDGYGGIGVTFERGEKGFTVTDVFADSPAAKAGVQTGDLVLAVNGQSLAPFDSKAFSDLVRGPIGTPLTLTISTPPAPPRPVVLIRQHVQPTTVSAHRDGDLGVIRITRFMPATLREFRHAAQQIMWSEPKAIVLDLEHNPGGLLESATDIAGLMLPRGEVARMQGRNPDSTEVFSSYGIDVFKGLPIYVLIDANTASAAEVLTVALQDRGRATVIGSTSFGKGSVQNVGPLPHGGEIAVTWARLFGPSGYTHHHQGIHPDVCVSRAGTTPAKAAQAARLGSERTPLLALQQQAAPDSAAEARLWALCPRSENIEKLALETVKLLENH